MSTSTPPPPPTSGNGKFLAIAAVIGLVMIGLLWWRFGGGPTPSTTVIPTASAVASNLNPSQIRPDDVPPPPADVPDSGNDVDAAKPAAVASTGGCDYKVCRGTAGNDLQGVLRQRVLQTRHKCYEPALAQDESLKGHIQVNVRVGTNGMVCSSTVGSNDMGTPSVAQCVASSFAGAHLPAPAGGCVDVQVPVAFSSGK